MLQMLFLAAVTGLAPFQGSQTGAAGAAMIFGYCITLGATWAAFPVNSSLIGYCLRSIIKGLY